MYDKYYYYANKYLFNKKVLSNKVATYKEREQTSGKNKFQSQIHLSSNPKFPTSYFFGYFT